MTDIEWGAEIAVNGVLPDWLRQTDTVNVHTGAGWVAVHDGTKDNRSAPLADWAWSHSSGRPCITAIRLPADHPYYLATSRGFTYWPGGESAPADWDGGDTLFRCGYINNSGVYRWYHNGPDWSGDIIGYRKRNEQPAPAIEPELVERAFAFLREIAKDGKEAKFEGHGVYFAARKILDALNPTDPDLTLAKLIVGDAEAIALAIKAARENAK